MDGKDNEWNNLDQRYSFNLCHTCLNDAFMFCVQSCTVHVDSLTIGDYIFHSLYIHCDIIDNVIIWIINKIYCYSKQLVSFCANSYMSMLPIQNIDVMCCCYSETENMSKHKKFVKECNCRTRI